MSAIHFNSIEPLKASKFLLLGIAAGLIAIYLNITWKHGNTEFLFTSVIFFVTACYLIWKKRHTLSLKTSFFSSLLGTLLIAVVLFKSTSHISNSIYVLPFMSALGIGLLASGFKGLKQYRSELLLLFFLIVHYATLYWLIDISEFTAKFAALVLWYLGFEVSRQGVYIVLPTGGIEVYSACSGMKNILDLCGLAVLLLVIFPTDWSKKILVPVAAILIGFVINGVRVVLMAILVASKNQTAFEYWHQGDGSLVFSMISVLFFGSFCSFMLRLDEEQEHQHSV